MADVDRDTITRYALRRLVEPSFRRLLLAVADDGSRPIIGAFRGDSFRFVLAEALAAGGAANVIVPVTPGMGFVVLALKCGPGADPGTTVPSLTSDCTIGVVIARLFEDGGEMTYYVTLDGSTEPQTAQADFAGVAE